MVSRMKRNTYDVFVGNLPAYVDLEYVEHMFKHSGEIANVLVRHSRFNKSKLAYVKFFCEPDAIKAVEKYKHLCLDGNALEVKLLPHRNEYDSSNVKNISSPGNNGCTNSAVSGVANAVSKKKSGEEELIVLVCHVESPVTFYGHNVSNLLELKKISEKLQQFCLSFSPVEGIPHTNQIYAARFSQDNLWYRCRVIQAEKYKSSVSYIDYGNDEYVSNSDIVILPDDLVKIPPQSSTFFFKDLKPTAEENEEIYRKAVDYLKQMLNTKVKLHTVLSTESFYFISKCISNGTDIYVELQEKGYAYKVPSSSEKSGSAQQYKMKHLKTNEKTADLFHCSKGYPQQNFNHKSNAHSPKSSSVDNTPKAASTFPKLSAKFPGKGVHEEVHALKLRNDKLTKELNLERKKCKALKQELEELKTKSEANHFEKVDSVILKVQQLFAIRDQNSSEDTSNLEEVYDVIKTKLPCNTQADHINPELYAKVEEAVLKYQSLVEHVGTFEQADALSQHAETRDEACKTACDLMKEYLESWSGDHLTERVVYLKKLLLEMEQKYDKYLKMDVKCVDKPLEELIDEYKVNKLKGESSLKALVKNTNSALSSFSTVIADLQKDITLPCEETKEAVGINIRFLKAVFLESLKKVQDAVEAEVVAVTMQPKSPFNETLMAALIKILIKEIQMPLEAALQEIEGHKKYSLFYPELCSILLSKPETSRIYDIRKEIKTLKSKIRHKLADKKDLEESDDVNTVALKEVNSALEILLHELHMCFREEHFEMMKLTSAYRAHFRELDIVNPDLNLASYSKSNGLVKENWEMEHFKFCSITGRPGICYSAKFCDDSVVIKEYHLNSGEYEQFLSKMLKWQSLQDSVVQVHAVFRSKAGFQTYAMFPYLMTLEESEKEFPFSQSDAGQVLRGVLKGLACIHSQGIMHSMLNPSTVLIMPNTCVPNPVLDFSFDLCHSAATWESKGIKFWAPEKELSQASDMYNFGCLILWMLFPNLHFTSTSAGVLDISGYKSIVEDLLSKSGYKAVESLLSIKPSARPTAKSLLEKDIFMEFKCTSSGEESLQASTAVLEEVLMAVCSDEVSTVVTSEESPGAASASDR